MSLNTSCIGSLVYTGTREHGKLTALYGYPVHEMAWEVNAQGSGGRIHEAFRSRKTLKGAYM